MALRPTPPLYQEFWALRDVSLEVRRGETVGIIGRNGSGKSTLLQIICGTLHQTAGTVVTNGRIAALLELGSGFNPDFTGEENIFLNGALLGLSRGEIEKHYDAIVSFAGIGQFIHQPIKTYSSGMVVRLAFSVQAMINPDILIVDEALAVGDARFQAKCFERLKQLKEQGTSILLVTHSGEQIVTHCSRAMLLDAGGHVVTGAPREVHNRYMDLLFGRDRTVASPPPGALTQPTDGELDYRHDVMSSRPNYNPNEYRWGDGAAQLTDFSLEVDGQLYPSTIPPGSKLRLRVMVRFAQAVRNPIFGITIKTKEGVTVYGTNSETLPHNGVGPLGAPGSWCIFELTLTCRLAQGDYFCSLGVASRVGPEVVPHDRRYDVVHLAILPDPRFHGLVDLEAGLRLEASEVNGAGADEAPQS
jgi:lipopolysaccharide transport system ATP-binding protein